MTRLVAKQVAETLDHPVTVMHASKGLEPGTHDRISQILEEEIPASLRSEVVVVSGPSHAEGDHRTGHHPHYSSFKDLEAARYVQELFSNHYFRPLYQYRCYRSGNCWSLEEYHRSRSWGPARSWLW